MDQLVCRRQRGFDGLPTGEFAQSLLQASDRDIALADDLASRARVFVQELSRAGIILTAEVFGPLRPLLDEARQALPDFTDRLRAGGRAVGDALAWAWRNMDGLLAGRAPWPCCGFPVACCRWPPPDGALLCTPSRPGYASKRCLRAPPSRRPRPAPGVCRWDYLGVFG